MRPLTPCKQCARHIDAAASTCPFCAASSTPSVPGPLRAIGALSRAAIFAGAAACWTSNTGSHEPTEPNGSGFAQPTAAATGTVRGTLTYSDGSPGMQLWVQLAKLDGSAPVQRVQAGPNGAYEFTNVGPGRYQIVVDWHPRRNAGPPSRLLDVVADAPLVADFMLQSPPVFDPTQIPAPYGAPPARRRIV